MGALYKSLVSPSHQNCSVIEKAVHDCLAKARRIFGEAATKRVSEVYIEFFLRGSNIAVATYGEHPETGKLVGVVQFSMQHVMRKLIVMVKQIVPHELAHVLCMVNGWDMGHGKVWRQVCMMLGGNGETCSTLHSVDGRVKYHYEVIISDGTSRWLTPKQRRELLAADMIVALATGETITLTKDCLTGKMKSV